ncbi:hypothetical protein [Kibdelosporangium aridum]|uniref:hypothetical protein n=1 Tax=Kibdelosporangium aridum TaxID=2030 RepID=UPI000B339CED|nr:hypothetical protein [Kibdelosporangium aridum]
MTEQGRPGVSRRQLVKYAGVGATFVASGAAATSGSAWAQDDEDRTRHGDSRNRSWRAGDHHVHSEYSGEFDTSVTPPRFHKGADAVYPIVTNATTTRPSNCSSWRAGSPSSTRSPRIPRGTPRPR